MAAKYRENRVGAMTQLCLTPALIMKGADSEPLHRMVAVMSSSRSLTMLMNFCGHAKRHSRHHRASRLKESKAFVRSAKAKCSCWCCSPHFSCSRRATKTMSVVPLVGLKPHCDSSKTASARGRIQLRRIRASIFPAIERRYNPR